MATTMQISQNKVLIGDEIQCRGCGHVHTANLEWLRAVIACLKRIDRWSDQSNDELLEAGFHCLPSRAIAHLQCGICKHRGAKNWVHTHPERVTVSAPATSGKYDRLCRLCQGFNGSEEYCYHCGGTGYEPTT